MAYGPLFEQCGRWQQLDETTNQTERLSALGRVYNRYDRQIKATLMSSSSIQDILYISTLFFSTNQTYPSYRMVRIMGGPRCIEQPGAVHVGCNMHFIVGLMAFASLLVSYAYDPWPFGMDVRMSSMLIHCDPIFQEIARNRF